MKKTLFFRIFMIALCVILLFAASSCAKDADDAALKYTRNGKTEAYLSKNLFSLWMSLQKSIYSSVAPDEKSWDQTYSTSEGTYTLAELIKDQALDSAKNLIAGVYLFDREYGLTMTSGQKDAVLRQTEDFIADIMAKKGYTARKQFDEYLSAFGANRTTLKEYFTLIAKYDLLYDYVCGNGGILTVTPREEMSYFKEHYAIVSHIFLNTGVVTKSDGTNVAMTDKEKQEQRALAEEIMTRLKAGEDFDGLRAQYSADPYGETMYPQGFFVTSDGVYPSEFERAALEMLDLELCVVESSARGSAVGIHIMKKLPMRQELYNAYPDILQKINAALFSQKFARLVAEHAEQVLVNEQVVSVFDMKKIVALE